MRSTATVLLALLLVLTFVAFAYYAGKTARPTESTVVYPTYIPVETSWYAWPRFSNWGSWGPSWSPSWKPWGPSYHPGPKPHPPPHPGPGPKPPMPPMPGPKPPMPGPAPPMPAPPMPAPPIPGPMPKH